MNGSKEVVDFGLCMLLGVVCSGAALWTTRFLRKPTYRKPTIPFYAHIDWQSLGKEELKRQVMRVVLACPGLVFGGIDPTLQHSYLRAGSQSDKELTDEYTTCLIHHLTIVACANNLLPENIERWFRKDRVTSGFQAE